MLIKEVVSWCFRLLLVEGVDYFEKYFSFAIHMQFIAEEEYVPPKEEVKKIEEKDAFYSKR